MEEFAVYECVTKNDIYTTTEMICGMDLGNGYIRKALRFNKFTEPIKIPPGFSRRTLHDNDVIYSDYYLRERIPRPVLNGLEQSNWINFRKDLHFTLHDLKILNTGDKVEFLVLDRNLYDKTTIHNKSNTLYPAVDYFKNNKAVYIHKYETKGLISFDGLEQKEFEFDIEYKPDHWYPMTDGVLPSDDQQNIFNLLGKKATYTDFPEKTRIGWRGPMIKWKNIYTMPDIFWHEE